MALSVFASTCCLFFLTCLPPGSSGSGSGIYTFGPGSVPPQPVGPPTLTPAPCYDRPGCYYLGLETAHPPLEDEMHNASLISPVAFLFRIETENVSYIWVVSGKQEALHECGTSLFAFSLCAEWT